jgi:hypothetical protein
MKFAFKAGTDNPAHQHKKQRNSYRTYIHIDLILSPSICKQALNQTRKPAKTATMREINPKFPAFAGYRKQ